MSDLRHCHPLENAGISRIERLIHALQPKTFRIDERSMQDMIVEAHRFAKTLCFFNEYDQAVEGKYWDKFWEIEILTYLAVLSAKDTDEILRKYQELKDEYESAGKTKPAPGTKKKSTDNPYAALLLNLRKLAVSIEEAYLQLVRINHPLQSLLLNRIRKENCCDFEELEGALELLIKYHKGADNNLTIDDYRIFFTEDKRWGIKGRIEYDAIAAQPSFNLEKLDEIFNSFFNTWLILKQAAQNGFDKELARMELPEDVEYRIVQPHVVLFLVFLKLFQYAQDSLNELGEKHLDYYYEEVLGLKRREAIPDETFLIFELAKDFDQYLVKKGTPFLAGKDANGRPLWFEAIEDWVMRSAKVADIKTTWIDKNCGGILANPDVKKVYENGTEKPNESATSWRSMGDNQHLPDGEVGFAIASPQLILREGKRTIDIELKLCNEIANPTELKESYFKVLLSSEEAWVEPVVASAQPSGLEQSVFSMAFQNNSIHLKVVLERDAPSIDRLGEDLAKKAGFDTRWPIVKLLIRPDLRLPCPLNEGPKLTTVGVYEIFRTLIVKEATIKVEAKGIRENLIIQSDQGKFDGTQKVFPFGPTPEVGNRFYIGSTEVFQKALDDLTVNFEWIAAPNPFSEYYKEYTDVDSLLYPSPSPQVLIDFVDRADGKKILLDQELRSGSLNTPAGNSDYNIQVKVSDVHLDGLPNVTVDPNTFILDGSNFTEDGLYTLKYPQSEVPNNPEITFKIPGGDYEEYKTKIANSLPLPALLELVLFPLEKYFTVLPASNFPIKGMVKNVYGELLFFSLILDAGTPSNQAGDYSSVTINSLPDNIEVVKAGYTAVNIDNTNKDFSIFDAILHLEPPALTNSNNFVGDISGSLTDASDNANPLGGVIVEARNSSGEAILITKTKRNNGIGDYELLDIPGAETLAFYHEHNRPLALEVDAPSITSPVSNFDAKLGPKQIEYVPLSQLVIQINLDVPQLSSSSVDVYLSINGTQEQNAIDYNNPIIRSVAVGAKLAFTAINYLDLEFEVNNMREYHLELLPDFAIGGDSFKTTQSASTGNIEIKFINLQPVLADLSINGSSNDLYLNGNNVRVNRTYSGGNVIISYPGYEVLTIPAVNDTEVFEVILNPSLIDSGSGVTGKIKGKITSLNASDKAKVCIYNNDYYFELNVIGPNSEFDFSLPSGTSTYHLAAFHDLGNGEVDFLTYPLPSEGKYFELSLFQKGKLLPSATQIQGVVRSSLGHQLEGVKVVEVGGSANTTRTNADGRFDINITAGSKLNFFHPLHDTIEISTTYENYGIRVEMLPNQAFIGLEGEVLNVYKEPISGVDISISINGDTSEKYKIGRSGGDGKYRISIPVQYADEANTKLYYYRAGYEETDLPFPSATNVTDQTNVNLSLLEIRMRNDEIDYTPLIENDSLKNKFNVKINALNLVRDIRTQEFDCYSPTLKRGFIRFTLEQDDFMHDVYPKMLTWYSLYAAGEIDLNIDGDNKISTLPSPPPIPNPPYAPATNNISIDYTSTQVITGEENNGIDDFFHLLPCNGYKEINIETFEHCFPLIYHYLPDDTNVEIILQGGNYIYDPNPYANGNLYIGIENLQPGGTLSLLFTVLAGSEKEPEALAPDIYWSYLSADNNWLLFPTGKILKDTTNGLTRTGLIQFQIPTDAVKENTMLNADYYWLRAAALPITKGGANARVQALPSLTGITAQVIQAQFVNRDNELGHLAQPLPAGTISKLAEGNIAVKKIEQPLDSFGGRLPESIGSDFIRRISERLRHKDRAITVWDYERLLLEEFDQIALAKCIQHTRYRPANKASERAPGYVTVAVIPDLAVRKGAPWAEPRFTQGDLDEMQKYLTGHTNLFVAYGDKEEAHLQLVNPLYEKVDILVKVAFKPGVDEAYAKQQLREALTYYISPWLVDIAQPPVFGRTLEKSAILQFIEEQAYVDYVDIDNIMIDENDNILESEDFLIRKSLTDLAGRPIVMHCEGTVEVNMGGNIVSELVKDAIVVKSKLYNGKICLGSERSILVAGDIVVGNTKDVINLPLLPFKINDTGVGGTGGGIESGFVSSLSQKASVRGKTSTKKTTTGTDTKAKSSVRSKQKSTATKTGKTATTKKTTAGRTRKKASPSTRKRKTTTSAKKDNSKK